MFVCVLFTTLAGEKVDFQEKKKMTVKLRREAKYMEFPVLVKEGDGIWMHYLLDNTSYPGKEYFDWLLNSEKHNNYFEAGWWCIPERTQESGDNKYYWSNEG